MKCEKINFIKQRVKKLQAFKLALLVTKLATPTTLTLYPQKTSILVANILVANDKRLVFSSGRSGSFLTRSWQYRTAMPFF